MKVVVLHPPLYPVNHKLFNELGQYCDLSVICFGNYPSYHANWKSIDFKNSKNNYDLIILEGKSASINLQFSTKYLKYIINKRPDVVLSIAFWIPSLFTSFLKYFLGFKYFILTDTTLYRDGSLSFFRKIVRKIIVNNSDFLLSGSQQTTKYLKTLTSSHSKIKNSYQVIDVKKWRSEYNNLPNKNELRKKNGFQNDDKILLSVGNLDDNKNISSILKNLTHLINYKLIIIGSGPSLDHLIELAAKLKINEQVYFFERKFNSELIEYFKLSDVFIFPTKMDTFGFVVSEALSSELPVICSKFAGASSMIQNNFNGFIIDPNKDYSNKIKLAFRDLDFLSKNALESVLTFTIEKKAKDLSDYFSKSIFPKLINKNLDSIKPNVSVYTIAFMGTDGSGKSTIIKQITPFLNKILDNRVYYDHMRPNKIPSLASLFGKQQNFSDHISNPHESSTSGFIGSLARWLYYMLDYSLGFYIGKCQKKNIGNSVWIFDRYYYDYLIDSKRARIKLPKWILKLGQFLIPEPNIILCLGTDAESIYSRKPELTLKEVERQVDALKKFSESHKRAVWVDTGKDIETSTNDAIEVIMNRININLKL